MVEAIFRKIKSISNPSDIQLLDNLKPHSILIGKISEISNDIKLRNKICRSNSKFC